MKKWRLFLAGMKWSTRILFFMGIVLLAYPIFTQAYTAMHQTRVSNDYSEMVAKQNAAQKASMKAKIKAKNEKIRERYEETHGEKSTKAINAMVDLNTKQAKEQKLIPDVGKPIGVLSIPVLYGLRLPIYDGVSDEVLSSGAGLIPGTSYPENGTKGVHSVLTTHSGLPTSQLFTNLVKMKLGDKFYIEMNGETLTYKVDQIKVVKPEKLDTVFKMNQSKNYVTLLTCTPTGVNTHRLLVRGTQIASENIPDSAIRSEYVWAILMAVVIAITMLVVVHQFRRWRQRRRGR